MKKEIIKGTRYGKLVVICEGEYLTLPSGQKNRTVKCKCDCGTEKQIRLLHLSNNRIKSCGCSLTLSGKPFHNKSYSKIYTVWRGMKNRVTENYPEKHLYFDKNITVCDEWKNDFEVFEKWCLENGYKEKLQLDRKNNSKGYFPDNCRFVTATINVNNRDNTVFVFYNGKEIPFTDAIRLSKKELESDQIRSRISRGWIAQRAIDTPIRKGNYKRKTK